MIDEHGLQLAADFMSEYGIRLADVALVWPPREVLALAEGLPAGSRIQARLAGGDKWRDFWGWDKDRHMLADLMETLARLNGDKKWTYPRPNAEKKQQGTPFLALVPRKPPKGD